MKTRIRYDATGGNAVPDGKAEQYVLDHLGQEVSVSNEIVIGMARALVHEGTISCDEIEFLFNDCVLKCDKDGMLEKWPSGFCEF